LTGTFLNSNNTSSNQDTSIVDSIHNGKPTKYFHLGRDYTFPYTLEGNEIARPHRLDRVHPIQLGFQINLSLVSLDSTTLDNRPNKELNKLISLSLRDLLHLKFHIQFKLSHIPILAIEEALSCERLKSLGNCSANLELPSHRSFQKLVSHSLPTTTQISFLTIF
jgi:hypothetical protein